MMADIYFGASFDNSVLSLLVVSKLLRVVLNHLPAEWTHLLLEMD